jgi:hypothetical protein
VLFLGFKGRPRRQLGEVPRIVSITGGCGTILAPCLSVSIDRQQHSVKGAPPQSACPRPAGRGRTAPRSPSAQGRPASLLRLPAGRFRPPHCPNRNCSFYEPRPDWKYSHWGFYKPPSCPRPIPRYQCLACDRTFTARTFAVTYWLHHWDLFALIASLSVAGSGVRQMGRTLRVSHATVSRHLTRAARCCLLRHQQMLQNKPLVEPVAIDGFETFEHSQFFPYHANLAVGKESWFVYHFTDSPLRRKGTMTPEQKQRRQELEVEHGRPDPKAIERGVLELLQRIVRLVPKAPELPPSGTEESAGEATSVGGDRAVLELHSDDHPAYLRALRQLRQTEGCPQVVHQITPSTDPRTRSNRLFSVNLADLLLRHCEADHRRETIAFDKRRQGGLERAAIFAVWRNAIKWRRENRPGETAAMRAGILDRPLSWREVFRNRMFPRERELPGVWWDYYWRRVKTAALGERQTENRAGFAF